MKIYAILALAAALLGIGFYAGNVWTAHQRDASDIAALKGQLNATQGAFNRSQTDWKDAIAKFRQDRAALATIAQEYADDRDTNDSFYRTLRARMAKVLAARPGIAACDIGPDGLRAWNDANRGATAAGGDPHAPAAYRSEPARAVSAAATVAERPVADVGRQPYRGRGSVQHLPRPAQQDDTGRAQARSDRGAAGSPSRSRDALVTHALTRAGAWM